MNVINWSKIKQELPSIFLLSAFQVWWSLNYQPYFYFGKYFTFLMSVFGIFLIVFMFSKAESFKKTFDMFRGPALAAPIVAFSISLLISWYKDFYNMPSYYYLVLFLYYFLMVYLFYRAAYRNASSVDTQQL